MRAVAVPPVLLVAVAVCQIGLAKASGLTAWKGGGFGMFSTTDDGGRRWVRVYVTAPERSEEIAISPSLEDAADRAAVLPSDAALARLARRVVERERRNGRPVHEVRIEAWRTEFTPGTLAAFSRRLRDVVHHVDAVAPPRP
jgi:hypothetical protein